MAHRGQHTVTSLVPGLVKLSRDIYLHMLNIFASRISDILHTFFDEPLKVLGIWLILDSGVPFIYFLTLS